MSIAGIVTQLQTPSDVVTRGFSAGIEVVVEPRGGGGGTWGRKKKRRKEKRGVRHKEQLEKILVKKYGIKEPEKIIIEALEAREAGVIDRADMFVQAMYRDIYEYEKAKEAARLNDQMALILLMVS